MKRAELISASAGSGKTYALTENLSTALSAKTGEAGAVRPDGVIAVTFTRKAAAELGERVRRRLIEDGHYEAARAIELGLVGTVDSVCGRLVREFSFELGLSPDAETIPEEEADAAFAEAIATLLQEEGPAQLRPIARRLGVESVQDHVSRIAELARSNRMDGEALTASAERSVEQVLGFLPGKVSETEGVELERRLVVAVDDAIGALRASGSTQKNTRGAINNLERYGRDVRNPTEATWYSWAKLARLSPAKALMDLVEPVMELAEQHTMNPRFHDDLAAYVRGVFDLARGAIVEYDDWKSRNRLLDFVDLETRALDLLELPEVADELRQRFDVLLVDEFQDTNPIQLALFLRLGELAGRVVWVGDEKQAIYGFRGSDPELVQAVTEKVADPSMRRTLEWSWRSRPALVRLTSEAFARGFAGDGIPPERVRLEPKRDDMELAGTPPVEWWLLETKNVDEDAAVLALRIRDLIDEEELIEDERSGRVRQVEPGDIAVLCRSNAECERVAAALEVAGVRAAISRPGLLGCAEARLAKAALTLALEPRDSLAAAEVSRLGGCDGLACTSHQLSTAADDAQHPAVLSHLGCSPRSRRRRDASREAVPANVQSSMPPRPSDREPSWAQRLADLATKPGEKCRLTPDEWLEERIRQVVRDRGTDGPRPLPFEKDPLVARVYLVAGDLRVLSPSEALDTVIEAVGLDELCLGWGNATQRFANVEALRTLAAAYEEHCRYSRSAATVAGLLSYLAGLADSDEDAQAEGVGRSAVRVLTYHRAKGLEWPVVVMASLNKGADARVFEPVIEPPDDGFDATNPLEGRWIRFWPWPYQGLKKGLSLREAADGHPVSERAQHLALAESRRLLYVGMTRARDQLVLVVRARKSGLACDWLEDLEAGSEEPIFNSPNGVKDGDRCDVLADAGDAPVEALVRRLTVMEGEVVGEREPEVWFDRNEGDEHLAAKPKLTLGCSGARFPDDLEVGARAAGLHEIGAPFEVAGATDWLAVGNTMHVFLGADLVRPAVDRLGHAATVLEAYGLTGVIRPETCVAISDRLRVWQEEKYPGAGLLTELPLLGAVETAAGPRTLMGYADLVLETSQGFVLVDHKSHSSGEDDHLRESAVSYAPQLLGYATLIEMATGKKLIATLIHFPFAGKIVEVEVDSGAARSLV